MAVIVSGDAKAQISTSRSGRNAVAFRGASGLCAAVGHDGSTHRRPHECALFKSRGPVPSPHVSRWLRASSSSTQPLWLPTSSGPRAHTGSRLTVTTRPAALTDIFKTANITASSRRRTSRRRDSRDRPENWHTSSRTAVLGLLSGRFRSHVHGGPGRRLEDRFEAGHAVFEGVHRPTSGMLTPLIA